jgi:hypothetical protein
MGKPKRIGKAAKNYQQVTFKILSIAGKSSNMKYADAT